MAQVAFNRVWCCISGAKPTHLSTQRASSPLDIWDHHLGTLTQVHDVTYTANYYIYRHARCREAQFCCWALLQQRLTVAMSRCMNIWPDSAELTMAGANESSGVVTVIVANARLKVYMRGWAGSAFCPSGISQQPLTCITSIYQSRQCAGGCKSA